MHAFEGVIGGCSAGDSSTAMTIAADSTRSLDRSRSVILVVLIVLCPQREIITKKLHDERAVFVRRLVKGIKLRNSVIERVLG